MARGAWWTTSIWKSWTDWATNTFSFCVFLFFFCFFFPFKSFGRFNIISFANKFQDNNYVFNYSVISLTLFPMVTIIYELDSRWLQDAVFIATREFWTANMPCEWVLNHNLRKGMATHFSILDWRISWMEELGGLQSKGLQRVQLWVAIIFTFFLLYCWAIGKAQYAPWWWSSH